MRPQEHAGIAGSETILVTGATGFIGSRLISAFERRGIATRAMSRREAADRDLVRFVQADAFSTEQLRDALDGIKTAYYLLHSMEGGSREWRGFADRERRQAQNFLRAATEAGVERIIYLGGLVNDSGSLSDHMQSRIGVGRVLASGSVPVTELRASMIIGAGGGSYSMLKHLVKRLHIMVCPRWVKSLAQPISADDVICYLAGCAESPETAGRILEIGGPEKVTYEEMMRQYAASLGRRLHIVIIPFLTTRLSSYWVDLVTPVRASLARPLIDSMVHDTTVADEAIRDIIPMRLKTVGESIESATREESAAGRAQEQAGETGRQGFSGRMLLPALIACAALGTTYYWLDGRPEILGMPWIALSALWYVAIMASILLVRAGTRLGYLVAGLLAWCTAAFWLADSYHVVFQMSLIAGEPNAAMTVRNLVGVLIAAAVIVASHNAFHQEG